MAFIPKPIELFPCFVWWKKCCLGCFIILLISVSKISLASHNPAPTSQTFGYIESGLRTGFIVPNYPSHPPSTYIKSVFLNLGRFHLDSNKTWAVFNNYPLTGLLVSYTELGNAHVLGNELRVLPYIEYNTGNMLNKSFFFKVGLGGSYISKTYNPTDNTTNRTVGSHFNWAFELSAKYNVWISERGILRLGGAYIHSSNGHVQLPNVGLNMSSVNVSWLVFTGRNTPNRQISWPITSADPSKNYFWNMESGIGLHELGGPFGPAGGAKKTVQSLSLGGGVVYRKNLKAYTGLSYRYYEHFFNYFSTESNNPDNMSPILQASNVYAFLGTEILYGHIGFKAEGGLNLFKPFYSVYNELYNKDPKLKYMLKYAINTSMGIKLYALNTNNIPRNNVYLGVSIHANFGQADFSGLSLGYVRHLPNL